MKLRTALVERLAAEPETGDGYWLVAVRSWDGREFTGVGIIDGEMIHPPPDLQPREVVAVLVGDLWIADCTGWQAGRHRQPARAPDTGEAGAGRSVGLPTVAPRSLPRASLPGPTSEQELPTSPRAVRRHRQHKPTLLAAFSQWRTGQPRGRSEWFTQWFAQ